MGQRTAIAMTGVASVSAADARYDQVMDMMSRVLQGQKETEEKICAMTEKQEVEKKEKEELSWEARAKEQEAVPSAALAGGAEAQGASVLESPAAPAAPEPESQGKAEPSGHAAEEIQFI